MDATSKPVTQDTIRSLLQRSDAAVEEALLRLYERQTQDEKQAHDAKHRNHRGFSGRDAAKGTKYAQWIIGMRRDHKAKPGEGLRRADHKVNAREITLRYTRQLLEVATEKAVKAPATFTTQAQADLDEAEMNAIVRQGEREENRRVAEFKALCVERLQGMALSPGTKITTTLTYGYPTIPALELSGTFSGDRLRITLSKGSGTNERITGLVTATGRTGGGRPANRVLFGRCLAWVYTNHLSVVTNEG